MLNKAKAWLDGYSTDSPDDGNKKGGFSFDNIKKAINGVLSDFFVDDSMVKANEAYESLLALPQFRHLLPYRDYIERDQLFIIEGNGIDSKGAGITTAGFVLEFMPQTGADEGMEAMLNTLYMDAPEGTSISFTLFATPHIKDRLIDRANHVLTDEDLGVDKYSWQPRNKNVFRQAIRKRIDFYHEGAFKSKIKGMEGALFRDMRTIVSIVLPTNLTDSLAYEEAIQYRETVMATLKTAHLESIVWGPKDLINWVSDMLNHDRLLDPNHDRIIKDYNPLLPTLKDNFTNNGGMATIEPNQISFTSSDSAMVTMSVTDYPKAAWVLGNMTDLIGEFFTSTMTYTCPFMITMNAVCGNRQQFQSKASLMSARKTQQVSSQAAPYMPGLHEEKAEWDYAVSALEGGATMVNMGLKVTLFSRKNEVRQNIAKARSIWVNRGFGIAEDTFLTALGFKAVIPMGLTTTVFNDMMKMGHLSPRFSTNAVTLSPILGEWKGSQHNKITLFGRRGQIMGFDLFDNDKGNYNFSIAAGSGSGKSFFTNELVFSYLSSGARVRVIDVGYSYVRLCELMGGLYVEFDDKSDIVINPFTHIKDIAEDMEVLTPLITQMMVGNHGELSGVQQAELQRAILEVWNEKGNKATMTNIRDKFIEMCDKTQPMCPLSEMAKMLNPWTKDGVYGRYFEGDSNLDFSNPLIVLELEALGSKQELQAVVLLTLMMRISNEVYEERDATKKIVLIDEAWALMEGKNTKDFIVKGYRRARKYGTAYGTVTQSIVDYYANAATEAAFTNSDYVFLLRQKSETIEKLDKEAKFTMSPWKKRALIDLTTQAGSFSEIMVTHPGGEAVGRFLVDAFTNLLYSSRNEDLIAIKEKREQGLSMTEAIQAVLVDRGLA